MQGYLLAIAEEAAVVLKEGVSVFEVQLTDIRSALSNKPFLGSLMLIKAWVAASRFTATTLRSSAEFVVDKVMLFKIAPLGNYPANFYEHLRK